MSKATRHVLADALRLEPDARAELAAELLASLDGPADPDAERAWDAEIERRIAAIEAGTIPLESWDEVRRRIEKDVLRCLPSSRERYLRCRGTTNESSS